MATYHGYSEMLNAPDLLISKIEQNLNKIDSQLARYIDFNNKVQIENLLDFIKESNERISKYEHIYPFIKEICTGQQVDPFWNHKIEQVLEWALKKGRGVRNHLSEEIKDAWLTYIVVLSCSMIDKESHYFSNIGHFEVDDNLKRFKENN